MHHRFNKPVVFLEAGYGRYSQSHRTPWSPDGASLDPAHQALCYQVWLREFQREPWLKGAYWWKAGTVDAHASDGHDLWGSPAMQLLREWHSLQPE